jgi:GNAT superfamily N-acetyltransferase
VSTADGLITSGEQDPVSVERLLGLLPTWFGIPASNEGYIAAARELPTYLAWPPGARTSGPDRDQPVGVLLAARHFPQSAEIHLMAVDPALHRSGVGRALVSALEADLVADGAQFLQVKTLGPSHPDPGYQLTRKFYLGVGFIPLEELHGLWGEGQPTLIMIKRLALSPAGGDQS